MSCVPGSHGTPSRPSMEIVRRPGIWGWMGHGPAAQTPAWIAADSLKGEGPAHASPPETIVYFGTSNFIGRNGNTGRKKQMKKKLKGMSGKSNTEICMLGLVTWRSHPTATGKAVRAQSLSLSSKVSLSKRYSAYADW